jgi:hypothetical protein
MSAAVHFAKFVGTVKFGSTELYSAAMVCVNVLLPTRPFLVMTWMTPADASAP